MGTLEDVLADIQIFMQNHLEGIPEDEKKAAFWYLYSDRTSRINRKSSTVEARNFTYPDFENSYALLKSAIEVAARTNHPYLMVSLLRYNTDSNPVNYSFPNPLYRRENYTLHPKLDNTLQHSYQKDIIFEMLKQQQVAAIGNNDRVHQLEMELMRVQMKQEMDAIIGELENRLHLAEQQQNKGISRFLTPQNIAKIAGAFGLSFDTDDSDDSAQQQTDQEPLDKEQMNLQYKEDLQRLKNIFGDLPGLINSLANFAEKDPRQAKFWFKQMKNQ